VADFGGFGGFWRIMADYGGFRVMADKGLDFFFQNAPTSNNHLQHFFSFSFFS
jgi:hypothetical protein